MRERPLSVTLAGLLFILVGAGGILKDVIPLAGSDQPAAVAALQAEGAAGLTMIWGVRLLAVVGGAFVLGGWNWARWLLAAWMVLHVVISLFHSPLEVVMHVVIFAVLSYALFRPAATEYFAPVHGRPWPGDQAGGGGR